MDPLDALGRAFNDPLSVGNIITCIGVFMIAGYAGQGAGWLFVKSLWIFDFMEKNQQKAQIKTRSAPQRRRSPARNVGRRSAAKPFNRPRWKVDSLPAVPLAVLSSGGCETTLLRALP
jgi:hypothetical protein